MRSTIHRNKPASGTRLSRRQQVNHLEIRTRREPIACSRFTVSAHDRVAPAATRPTGAPGTPGARLSGLLGCLLILTGTAWHTPVLAEPPESAAPVSNVDSVSRRVAEVRPIAVTVDRARWQRDGASLARWEFAFTEPGARHLSVSFAQLTLPPDSTIEFASERGDVVHRLTGTDLPAPGVRVMSAVVPGDHLLMRVTTAQPDAVHLLADRLLVGHTASRHKSTDQTNAPSDHRCALPTTPPRPDYNESCRFRELKNANCAISEDAHRQLRSEVGLLIDRGSFSTKCSGTLLNNTAEDGAHLILTAAHCAPDDQDLSEVSVTAYWDRTDSCGAEFDDFYLLPGPVTTGYTTATYNRRADAPYDDFNDIQTADVWLLRSTAPIPEGAAPFFAGWDARNTVGRDSSVIGTIDPSFGNYAYSYAHPVGYQTNYAQDNTGVIIGNTVENDDPENSSGYMIWITDFTKPENYGSVLQGSSGSALFDAQHRVRGIASAITRDSGEDYYFRLDIGWAPTLDGQPAENLDPNGTQAVGLAPFLDPSNSDQRVLAGREDPGRRDNIQVLLSSTADTADAGQSIPIEYLVDRAVSCERSAQPAVAEWSGAVNVQNRRKVSESVTNPTTNEVRYSLSCTNAAGFTKTRTIFVNKGRGVSGGGTGGGSGSGGGPGSGSGGNVSSSGGGGGTLNLILLPAFSIAAWRRRMRTSGNRH